MVDGDHTVSSLMEGDPTSTSGEGLRRSMEGQMLLWAHDVAPFGLALNLRPKTMLLAEAFGEAAGGDMEGAMKLGFVIAFSSLFNLA